jgi:hypothetical protein
LFFVPVSLQAKFPQWSRPKKEQSTKHKVPSPKLR